MVLTLYAMQLLNRYSKCEVIALVRWSAGEFVTTQSLGTAPHWHHPHQGEPRWPVTLVVLTVIGLQLSLPTALNVAFAWQVCAVEAALLAIVAVLDPKKIDAHRQIPRNINLALLVLMSGANIVSIYRLVHELLTGGVKDAGSLLLTGSSIWLTNVVVFALWYWEFDRGGPGARAEAKRQHPDFLFPQMSDPDLAPPHWASSFFDYLYLSFTNSSAFSPTDVLPLTKWAKALMLVQSLTSLLVVALVVARAVNILQ